MKKLCLSIVSGIAILSVAACKQPRKSISLKSQTHISRDNIVKNVYIDDEFGDDEMEVIIDNTNNTVTIHFEGETYQLSKNNDLPNYTAENSHYRFSDIKGEITFLKIDSDIVLFHHEPDNKKSAQPVSH